MPGELKAYPGGLKWLKIENGVYESTCKTWKVKFIDRKWHLYKGDTPFSCRPSSKLIEVQSRAAFEMGK